MSSFKFSSLVRCLFPFAASRNNDAQKEEDGAEEANVLKKDSVYIQDVNGKLWKTEEWDDSVKPNAIAVIADETKFLIALTQAPSKKALCNVSHAPLEEYMVSHSREEAMDDYDGAGNTEKIIMVEASKAFAAGYCDNFIFPDGKTRGYLPSLGQLVIAYRNKVEITFALRKCGGDAMVTGHYWSSTCGGTVHYRIIDSWFRECWLFDWCGSITTARVVYDYQVRPFADFQVKAN